MTRIIIPKPYLHLNVGVTVGMKGFLRLQCINKFSGKVTQDTGWFPNTILDAGRNIMADRSDWIDCCQVGTNGTFPAALIDKQAETSLGNYYAGTSNVTTTTNGQAASAPYYGWKRRTYRFASGTVAANLQEAGIGWSTAGGSTLICRAPILDPILGTPTTITPLADELLDVTYELRYYPPLVDVTSPQVTLDGVAYDTITRAASVTGDRWSASIGTAMGVYNSLVSDWRAFDGVLGAITSTPSGTSANWVAGSIYNSAYSNNSYQVVLNCIVASTGWNLVSGIRSLRIRTTAGDYQTQFDAAAGGATIPKTSAYTMTMAWTLAWAEYV